MQYFSMIHYRQSLLETDILVSNLKKRRALSSTSISLNKIRNMNIVFLIFLIRIKQYNTSKIRIIQTRIMIVNNNYNSNPAPSLHILLIITPI